MREKRQAVLGRDKQPSLILGFVVPALAVVVGATSTILGWDAALQGGGDFLQDYVSANALLDGDDPHDAPVERLVLRYVGPGVHLDFVAAHRNAHTTTNVLAAVPLARLPYEQARAVWLGTMATLMCLAVFWTARAIGWSTPFSIMAGGLSLMLPPVQRDLVLGQTNAVVLLLLLGSWVALRRGRQGAAGVAVGVAAALKVFPVFVLLVFFRLGARRAIAWAAGTLLAAGVISVAAIGPKPLWNWAVDVAPGNLAAYREFPFGISLSSIPWRWLTENPWRDNPVHISTAAQILSVAAVVLCVWALIRSPVRLSGDPFWAAVPWALLAFPLSWDHYLVIAIPLVLIVVNRYAGDAIPRRPLLLVPAIIVLISPLPGGYCRGLATELSNACVLGVWSLPTYALLTLGLLEWVSLRPTHDGSAESTKESPETSGTGRSAGA